MYANGICNDEANNAECNYDGGDCCGACVNTEYCTEYVCHEGGEPLLDLSCKWSFDDAQKIIITLYSKHI